MHNSIRIVACVSAFILSPILAVAQTPPPVPTDIPKAYQERELQASFSVWVDLDNLRRQAAEKNGHFK